MEGRSGRVEVNGAELRYEIGGSGPAVVFLHAAVADLRMWENEARALRDRYAVLRYSARGFGNSTAPGGPYSMVDDLVALLDHFAIGRAALVGCSMGASTALDLALEHPARAGALVLVGAGLDGYAWSDEMTALDAAEEAAFERGDADVVADINISTWVVGPRRKPEDVDPDVVALARDMILTACATQIPAFAREPAPGPPRRAEPPAIERLEEVRAPACVVVGTEDVEDIRAIARLLTERIPGAEGHVLQDAAHLPNLERPEAFMSVLEDFLARTWPPS